MRLSIRLRLGKNYLRALKVAGRALDFASSFHPVRRCREQLETASRLNALSCLNRLSRDILSTPPPRVRNVLIDGMWDNPNYWTRYAILRRALNVSLAREVGLVGIHSKKKVRLTFAALGVVDTVDYGYFSRRSKRHINAAYELLNQVTEPNELLRLELPTGFPPSLLYDGILKRQRRSTIDLCDPLLIDYVADALACIEAAKNILAKEKFDLVVLSHALDYTYGSLAWRAVQEGIPVIVLYGNFGAARFLRLTNPSDLFAYPMRPSVSDMNSLNEEQISSLREQGAKQLTARFTGRTDDVGAIYAYHRRRNAASRELLCERFGWKPEKPIIGVYNSNWFDYPHSCGLRYFRDFLDWIEETLLVAKNHDLVNWVFKSHPCDDWYGSMNGPRLEDLVTKVDLPHIRLADKEWNGQDLILALDGIVTCHGSIGIEAVALGTPVSVVYPGWYGHAGFVTCPKNRDDYLAMLKTAWWRRSDKEQNKSKAELFSGWMFCLPDWHGGYKYLDDSRQEAIYPNIPEFISRNQKAIDRETVELSNWFETGSIYYHLFKMKNASGYQSGNLLINESHGRGGNSVV